MLASVPGTPQAVEAVLLAQVPQTAVVNRKQIKAPEVNYQGDPQFVPIPSTTVSRAVNTDKDIIKVGDLYYMCFQGVWFMGKSATGPWEAATSVPGQIYEIPVSSPAHNVTYVTVEDSDDDTATYVAAAAYTGMMVAWGCAVWGTGYYYPPYVWYGGGYPAYYGHYPSTGTVPPITRGPAHTREAAGSTVRMAGPAWPRATTHGPARTPAARLPTVHTAQPVRRAPTTLAPARQQPLARVPAPMAVGAARRLSAAMTGPRLSASPTIAQGTQHASRARMTAALSAGTRADREADRRLA